MRKDIKEAISDLQEEILEKQKQIELIKKIDWTQPVTETVWHEICETPLRTSDMLGVLVKNIFPDAKDICVHCNYVYFYLYGFKCALPTSGLTGVYIDTEWYQRDKGKPILSEPLIQSRMRRYFQEKDNGESWRILFDERLPRYKSWNICFKFVMWFFFYRWKDDHRDEWEEEFSKTENRLIRSIDKYNQTRKEMYERAKTMTEMVIPELRKFAPKVYNLQNGIDPEEIARLEGLF